MAEHIHKIFRFVDPPDEIALRQCVDAVDACFFPWERCVPELEREGDGFVTVIWDDSGQGNTGTYHAGTRNLITLNNRYTVKNYAFTMLHEAGHMVDDTMLRDDQRKALVEKWHTELDGRWDGQSLNGGEISWSHNTPHTHSEYDGGWRVSDAEYYHRPNEAFADAFVACFAPSYFPYKRFAHWSDDIEGVRAIILSVPEELKSPFAESTFRNDSIYRLYRAYFLREPDADGYAYWKKQLLSGMKPEDVSGVFATSPEFASRYGSLTSWGFVKLVYQNVLDRQADQEGLNHWVDALNRGYSRGFVMVQFSESPEFIKKIETERE